MTYVVESGLVGRYVAPRDVDAVGPTGPAPWVWKYNPGPAGAKILAVYAMPDGQRSVVVFVVQGQDLVLEQGPTGGGSRSRTRIDEIVATECVVLPRMLRHVCGDMISEEDVTKHACPQPQRLGPLTHETMKARSGPSQHAGTCAGCGGFSNPAHALSFAREDNRICQSIELCSVCREGVERSVRVDAEFDAGEGAALIVKERARQLKKWSPEHDDEEHHTSPSGLGGLVDAANALLVFGHVAKQAELIREARLSAYERWIADLVRKHQNDRRRQLVIAGALIAAEIDRLAGADEPKGCGP